MENTIFVRLFIASGDAAMLSENGGSILGKAYHRRIA
jgi:hypothetical protein